MLIVSVANKEKVVNTLLSFLAIAGGVKYLLKAVEVSVEMYMT